MNGMEAMTLRPRDQFDPVTFKQFCCLAADWCAGFQYNCNGWQSRGYFLGFLNDFFAICHDNPAFPVNNDGYGLFIKLFKNGSWWQAKVFWGYTHVFVKDWG